MTRLELGGGMAEQVVSEFRGLDAEASGWLLSGGLLAGFEKIDAALGNSELQNPARVAEVCGHLAVHVALNQEQGIPTSLVSLGDLAVSSETEVAGLNATSLGFYAGVKSWGIRFSKSKPIYPLISARYGLAVPTLRRHALTISRSLNAYSPDLAAIVGAGRAGESKDPSEAPRYADITFPGAEVRYADYPDKELIMHWLRAVRISEGVSLHKAALEQGVPDETARRWMRVDSKCSLGKGELTPHAIQRLQRAGIVSKMMLGAAEKDIADLLGLSREEVYARVAKARRGAFLPDELREWLDAAPRPRSAVTAEMIQDFMAMHVAGHDRRDIVSAFGLTENSYRDWLTKARSADYLPQEAKDWLEGGHVASSIHDKVLRLLISGQSIRKIAASLSLTEAEVGLRVGEVMSGEGNVGPDVREWLAKRYILDDDPAVRGDQVTNDPTTARSAPRHFSAKLTEVKKGDRSRVPNVTGKMDLGWGRKGLCVAVDPQSGKPYVDPDSLLVDGSAQKEAAKACMACPVITECLATALDGEKSDVEDALKTGVKHVCGGMTDRGRRAMLRRYPNVASWWDLLGAQKVMSGGGAHDQSQQKPKT